MGMFIKSELKHRFYLCLLFLYTSTLLFTFTGCDPTGTSELDGQNFLTSVDPSTITVSRGGSKAIQVTISGGVSGNSVRLKLLEADSLIVNQLIYIIFPSR